MPETDRILGEYGARLEGLKGDVEEIKSDVKQLLAAQSEFQGAKKTIYTVAAVLGAASSVVASAALKLLGK